MWQVSFFILPTDILIEKQCMPVFKTRVPRGSSHFFILPTGISKENNVCRFSKREPEAGLRKASSRPKFCAKLISEATPPRPTSAERRNTVRAHRSLAASLPVCCRLRHARILPRASAPHLSLHALPTPEPRQPARLPKQTDHTQPTPRPANPEKPPRPPDWFVPPLSAPDPEVSLKPTSSDTSMHISLLRWPHHFREMNQHGRCSSCYSRCANPNPKQSPPNLAQMAFSIHRCAELG